MFYWLAAMLHLCAVLFFITKWMQNKRPDWLDLGITVMAGTLMGGLTSLLRIQAVVVTVPMAGFFTYSVSACARKYRNILPGLILALCSALPWLPFCFSKTGEPAVMLAVILVCVFMMVYDKLPDPGKDRRQEGRYGWYIWLPAGILPAALLPLTPLVQIEPITAAICLSALLALLVFLMEQIRQKQEAQKINVLMGRWQQESRDYMNTIRSQRHDFNLHMHAISGLVKNEDYDQVQQYVSKLVAEAAAVNDIMPIADAVVGSMLYNMRQEARAHGSDIYYHITYDMEDVLCNGFVVNKILGNLLQNAIDAMVTQQARDYGIHLRIFKRRGNTVITVENWFDADPAVIARVFEPGYSTKQNHEGIGLSMVLRAAEQCGGRVYPEFEDTRIRFVVNIPNKVTLKGGGDA